MALTPKPEKEKKYLPGLGATKIPESLMALPTFSLINSNGITVLGFK
jgi:hypothetical protein